MAVKAANPSAGAKQPKEAFRMVATESVFPNPFNPRKTFAQAQLVELAESVKAHGILQPLVVRLGQNCYELVAGERRLRAARLAGLSEVPVVVRDLTDKQVLEVMVVENSQRQDVPPLEEAEAFYRLVSREDGWTVDELAARIGRSVQYVADRVSLHGLIPKAQEKLASGELFLTHAVYISRFGPETQARALLEAVPEYSGPPTLSKLKERCRRLIGHLDAAPFDLADATLYPERGACTTCPLNSACTATLFPDEQASEAGCCADYTCLEKKAKEFYERRLRKLDEEHGATLVPIFFGGDQTVCGQRKSVSKWNVDLVDGPGEGVEAGWLIDRDEERLVYFVRHKPVSGESPEERQAREAKRKAEEEARKHRCKVENAIRARLGCEIVAEIGKRSDQELELLAGPGFAKVTMLAALAGIHAHSNKKGCPFTTKEVARSVGVDDTYDLKRKKGAWQRARELSLRGVLLAFVGHACLAEADVSEYSLDSESHVLDSLAQTFGVSRAAIVREVTEDLTPKPKKQPKAKKSREVAA